MWLFTTDGFISVVQHRAYTGCVLVRAREKMDLERFLQRLPERHLRPYYSSRITHTPQADYGWRVLLSKQRFADLVREYIYTALNYDNFKNKCHYTLPPQRCDQLMGVWALMRGDGRELVPGAEEGTIWSIPQSPSNPPRKKAKKHTKRLKGGIS
jgi:hypothetical protein